MTDTPYPGFPDEAARFKAEQKETEREYQAWMAQTGQTSLLAFYRWRDARNRATPTPNVYVDRILGKPKPEREPGEDDGGAR